MIYTAAVCFDCYSYAFGTRRCIIIYISMVSFKMSAGFVKARDTRTATPTCTAHARAACSFPDSEYSPSRASLLFVERLDGNCLLIVDYGAARRAWRDAACLLSTNAAASRRVAPAQADSVRL